MTPGNRYGSGALWRDEQISPRHELRSKLREGAIDPPLVVINNQVATLQVGDVLPVVSTGSATVLTTSNTVVNSQIFH